MRVIDAVIDAKTDGRRGSAVRGDPRTIYRDVVRGTERVAIGNVETVSEGDGRGDWQGGKLSNR